jgi:hypothetical protein
MKPAFCAKKQATGRLSHGTAFEYSDIAVVSNGMKISISCFLEMQVGS